MTIKNRFFITLILFIISLFVIIIGIVLTISIIFFYIGIPMIIAGVILILVSILSFFGATISSIFSLFKFPKKKIEIKETPRREKKKKAKIIDVREEEGVFKAK